MVKASEQIRKGWGTGMSKGDKTHSCRGALDFAPATSATKDWTLVEQLQALASFALIFSESGFQFGHWSLPEQQGEVTAFPYFSLSADAQRFVDTVYHYGWARNFDWSTWRQTPEAVRLRDHPDALSRAAPSDLAKLLTAVCRSDRFVEGGLAGDFKSGLLTRIVERAETLLQEWGEPSQARF